jgi:glycolate oxidase iron-sulfur subunit
MTYDFHQLPAVKDEIMKCVRCGQCRMVCPVFAEIRNETASPRGHVFMTQMLREGTVSPSSRVYDRLGRCLLCENCTVNCPAGLHIHEMNAAARSYIEQQRPQPDPVKTRVFDTMWSHPRRLKFVLSSLRLAQITGLRGLTSKSGIIKLVSPNLAEAEAILTDIPKQSALERLPEFTPAVGQKKYTVAYFIGCATNHLYPRIARATVKILSENGCDVIIPKNVKCCGLPHLANGKLDSAAGLVQHNLQVLTALKADYIVTDCASCASALQARTLSMMLPDAAAAENIRAVSARSCDLTEFLGRVLQLPETIETAPAPAGKKIKVTYHDPCHLANARKISKEPRALLKAHPAIDFVEMKDPGRCCGGSGTYSLTHYALSMRILQHKIDNIAASGAEVVATACPSCIMQLRHGLKLNGLTDIKVLHVAECMDPAFGK